MNKFRDISLILLGILAVVLVLNFFTEFVEVIHVMIVAGFSLIGLLITGFGSLLSMSGGPGGTKSLSSMSNPDIRTPADAVNRVNDLLDEEKEWDQIVADPKWAETNRKRIINKKDRNTEIYWAIYSRLKNRKIKVLVIYNESFDVIEDYDPDPSPGKRVDAFENFDPIEMGRMMSRGRDEEKDEKEEEDRPGIDFNIKDGREKEKEKGGWFS